MSQQNVQFQMPEILTVLFDKNSGTTQWDFELVRLLMSDAPSVLEASDGSVSLASSYELNIRISNRSNSSSSRRRRRRRTKTTTEEFEYF